jgi:RNA-binding protein
MRRIGHASAFAIKGHRIQARAPMPNPTAPNPTTPNAPAKTTAPPAALSSAQRRNLRAQAHHLEPVVQVGHHGVTDAVLKQVIEQLRAHELIKVRLHEPEDKQSMAAALAGGTGSTLCGLVGHTAILYKRHPTQPKSFSPQSAEKAEKAEKRSKARKQQKAAKSRRRR